jgi:hypothetical protein
VRQNSHVGSREIGRDDSRRGDGNNVQVTADQSFRTDAGAHHRNDLAVEPIFFKQLTFFDNEGDDVAHTDGRNAYTNFFERLALRKTKLRDS